MSETDKPYVTKDEACRTSGLKNAMSKVEIAKVWSSVDDSGKFYFKIHKKPVVIQQTQWKLP